MIHDRVDAARWCSKYPLAQHRARLEAEGAPDWRYRAPSDVWSPRELALTEQVRAEADAAQGPPPRRVPVDVLLPALGEPPRREVSKVGGLPYRPRGAWPIGRDGEPLMFLAQLCLADSRETLAGFTADELPGDVLLIFSDTAGDGIWSDDQGALRFEWLPLGLAASELVRAEDVPNPGASYTATYFELHPSGESCDECRVTDVGGRQIESWDQYWATKIGGVPTWQQDESDGKGRGRFFAQLHSINPCEDEYPFVNVPIPPWGKYPYDQGFLMLGDVGTLYLFAQGGGRIGWAVQCG